MVSSRAMHTVPEKGPPAPAHTIVDIASFSENFEILTHAVIFAGSAP